jgi:hypothetical protein
MWLKIRNFLANEALYLIGAPTIILLGIVVYGILYDYWYKDVYNISLASIMLYVLSIIFRFLGWISGKFKH